MILPASTEELEFVDKLRQEFVGKLDKLDDGSILRWIRAFPNAPEKCKEGLSRHLLFRNAWDIDNIESWKPPEMLAKMYRYSMPWHDKEGSPVLVFMFGNWDVEGMMKTFKVSDYLRVVFKSIMEGIRESKQTAIMHNRPYDQILFMLDMTDISPSHYSYKPFTNSYVMMLTMLQENFPLIFKKTLVLRAPSMAQYAFQLLTPILSDGIQQSIEMLGGNWRVTLSEYLETQLLPLEWGGRNESLEDFMPNVGPVPESFYYSSSNNPPDLVQMTVYAGDKRQLEFHIEKADSFLTWFYQTDKEDIGFAVYYVESNENNNNNEPVEMVTVYPYFRPECELVPETGSVLCKEKGKYMVEFDNTYSWFSAKELTYLIKIDSSVIETDTV